MITLFEWGKIFFLVILYRLRKVTLKKHISKASLVRTSGTILKKIDGMSVQNTQLKEGGTLTPVTKIIKDCLTLYQELLRRATQSMNNDSLLSYKLCLI